jgi:hypothetical protein
MIKEQIKNVKPSFMTGYINKPIGVQALEELLSLKAQDLRSVTILL